ncbi:MAG: hypothetical protein WC969_00695 [Elusimicrobiota bacterium]|jgi:outer membrane biosynthesis protein TonB
MIQVLLSAVLSMPVLAEEPKPAAPVETPKLEAPAKIAETPKAEAPKAETPKAETPKIETPKVEAPKVEAPKVEIPKAEAPKTEPVAAAPAPKPVKAKVLTECAACLTPLIDGYKGVLADLEKWTAEVDAQTAAAEESFQKLQKGISDNEVAITKAKLEGGKANKERVKELNKQNKTLWSELEAARKAKAALCKQFGRDASQKVREYNASIQEKLKESQSRMQ